MFLLRSVIAAASTQGAAAFSFVDPGPLVDGELELVAPDEDLATALLQTCHHPLTRASDPDHARLSREQIAQFLEAAPGGHEPPDPSRGRSPAYHFWMRLAPEARAPVSIAGTISLRVGHGEDLEQFFGHIGYNVYPPARGHHYAERSCRLLFGLARTHGLHPLWITTDPQNHPSRRTCERLGATLVNTVDIPYSHVLYARGQRQKCRYRVMLDAQGQRASTAVTPVEKKR